MKYIICVVVGLFALTAVASADWPHPVKWDQLTPGVDIMGAPSYLDDIAGDALTVDDFLCMEPGWVTDIRFAGSATNIQNLVGFRITFWSDTPATPNDESHPCGLLYDQTFGPADPADPMKLGWQFLTDDTWKIDIPRELWFMQEGTPERPAVYWIGIQGIFNQQDGAGDMFHWQFANRALPTWGDDAAFTSVSRQVPPWANWGWPTPDPAGMPATYDGPFPPGWFKSADMAFQLTGIPEPGTFVLLASGLGGLAFLRRRK